MATMNNAMMRMPTMPAAPPSPRGNALAGPVTPVGRNAMIPGPTAGTPTGTHRIDASLLEGLPPEFVQALFEIAELVDIDGDGTPDVAMVPLNSTGSNALMAGRGGQAQLQPGQLPPVGHFPRSIPGT